MSETRLTYLDIAAGIMTIWVMVFHAIYPMYEKEELAVFPWLYYFMPWFFYKSGMMFRPRENAVEIRNGWHKLIFTFIIWSAIGYVAFIGWHWFAGTLTPRVAFYSPLRSLLFKAAIPFNGALWFLPILFLVRIIGNWLLNKNIHSCLIAVSSLIIAVVCTIIHSRWMPTWVGGTAWGLFFFAMGYWLKDIETKAYVIVISSVLFVLSICTCIPSVYCGGQPLWANLLWYPACVCGCITFNNVCRVLDRIPKYVASLIGGGANGIIRYLHTSVAMLSTTMYHIKSSFILALA